MTALPNKSSDHKSQENDDYLLRLITGLRTTDSTVEEEITTLRTETRSLREETRRFRELALLATSNIERRNIQIGTSTIRVRRGAETWRARLPRAWRTHFMTIVIPVEAENYAAIINYYGSNSEAREIGIAMNSSIEQNITAGYISFGEP